MAIFWAYPGVKKTSHVVCKVTIQEILRNIIRKEIFIGLSNWSGDLQLNNIFEMNL